MTPELRHFVKLGDLDSLEALARSGIEELDMMIHFEEIFHALDKRTKIDRLKVLEWGRRYVAWAHDSPKRDDGLPILGTGWAKRMMKIAVAEKKPDLALLAVNAVLASHAPLEKERKWWQHERYVLADQKTKEL